MSVTVWERNILFFVLLTYRSQSRGWRQFSSFNMNQLKVLCRDFSTKVLILEVRILTEYFLVFQSLLFGSWIFITLIKYWCIKSFDLSHLMGFPTVPFGKLFTDSKCGIWLKSHIHSGQSVILITQANDSFQLASGNTW